MECERNRARWLKEHAFCYWFSCGRETQCIKWNDKRNQYLLHSSSSGSHQATHSTSRVWHRRRRTSSDNNKRSSIQRTAEKSNFEALICPLKNQKKVFLVVRCFMESQSSFLVQRWGGEEVEWDHGLLIFCHHRARRRVGVSQFNNGGWMLLDKRGHRKKVVQGRRHSFLLLLLLLDHDAMAWKRQLKARSCIVYWKSKALYWNGIHMDSLCSVALFALQIRRTRTQRSQFHGWASVSFKLTLTVNIQIVSPAAEAAIISPNRRRRRWPL